MLFDARPLDLPLVTSYMLTSESLQRPFRLKCCAMTVSEADLQFAHRQAERALSLAEKHYSTALSCKAGMLSDLTFFRASWALQR